MKQYSSFSFDSYHLDRSTGSIHLLYSMDDDVTFEETLLLPQDRAFPDILSPDLERALFVLHLIGGISYYKTACPKQIQIRSGTLSPTEAGFWNDVYEKGLGEFFYKNQIDFRGLIRFPFDEKADTTPPAAVKRAAKRRALVPIGGGKDSVVTAELLKKGGIDCTLMRMGSHPFVTHLAEEMGLPLLSVQRHLSKNLFALNAQGALNGHVPITGYLASLTTVLALLYGFDTVALSNERSANEGNVEYLGTEINHQWSKSLEFERAFASYLTHSVSQAVDHFSLLRPVSELTIAKVFADIGKYRRSVTSCNANWRIVEKRPTDRWCCKCPKCLFLFILFSAFIPRSELEDMFGSNLLQNSALLPLFKELIGTEGFKPFECVGTPEETQAALVLTHRRGDLDDAALMQVFLTDILPTITDPDVLITASFQHSKEHAVPKDLLPLLDAAR